MILHLTATTEQAGQRLDAFVAATCEGVSRSAAARLLEGGLHHRQRQGRHQKHPYRRW